MAAFGAIVRRGGRWLPLIGVASLAGAISGLVMPALLARAIDGLLAGDRATLQRWLVWVAVAAAAALLTDLLAVFAGTACSADTTAWLRAWVVRHVLAAGPVRASRFGTGDLVTRVTTNAADAAQAGPSVIAIVAATLPPVGSLVLLALIDLWLVAAFAAGMALVGAVLWAFTRHTARAMSHYSESQAVIAARLAESLAGARTIAAAGTLDRERRRVLQPLAELHRHGMLTWRALSRAGAQAAFVGPLVLVAVLAAGGVALLHGRITTGELFAAGQYATLGAGLGGLTGVLSRLTRARVGVRRVAEVLRQPAMEYGDQPVPAGNGTLTFEGVRVCEGGRTVLNGLDLTLPGGTAIAVVGRSGAGKSVLAALAARLREPDAGRITLDGVPLAELTHDALHAAISCAFERPVLVGTTVGEAIGFRTNRDRTLAAARATTAHEFISRLPDGYDTPLAEAPMSGGEAQRLGLARAWHTERVMVLDDATSSLDMVTEMRLAQALGREHGSRTRLIVTHRPSTAARADLVVWLDDGQVRAVGRHAELWRDPAYRAVFQ